MYEPERLFPGEIGISTWVETMDMPEEEQQSILAGEEAARVSAEKEVELAKRQEEAVVALAELER